MEPAESKSPPILEPDLVPVYAEVVDSRPIAHRVPLDGWFERNDFHPLMSAFLMFVISFLLFQGLASVVALVMVIADEGIPDPTRLLELVETATGALLVGNTVGQYLGMAVPVLLWTWLHTSRPAAFLRLSLPDAGLAVLSVLGLVALFPIIQWLGELNMHLPLPDYLLELEEAQLELIQAILDSDFGLPATVFALAVTPAICEELLFRGYLQRQFERAMGVAGGIVATGLLFGLYHFRLTQALPLAVLGIFLCWLAWRTGSLWIPILIHFLNNAFAIAAATAAAENPQWGIEDVEHLSVPIPIVLGAVALLAGILVLINRRVESLGAQPVKYDGR